MTLADLVDASGLPLNRKERYYTGTVFPAILCADNFTHFDRLASLLVDCPDLLVDANPSSANIQVYTEFGLWESVFDTDTRLRFPNPPVVRDTPDIVIYVASAPPVLIALEAKMFHRPTSVALASQMQRQREMILDYLAATLKVPPARVLHACLLPAGLLSDQGYDTFEYPIITWEAFLAEFSKDRSDDYWLSVLGLALERYDRLVSPEMTFGIHAKSHWSGTKIRAAFEAGTIPYPFMGRSQGIAGAALAKDVQTGAWRSRLYELTDDVEAPNSNWFAVSDFVALIGTQTGEPALEHVSSGPPASPVATEAVERAVHDLREMGMKVVTPADLFEAANNAAWDMGLMLASSDVWVAVYDWGGYDYYGDVPPDTTQMEVG